jgi:hypothetical protein
VVLAALTTLLTARPAYAHRLEAEAKVQKDHTVTVESWFETGDTPKKATVQVLRADGSLLAEGPLNEETGKFVFKYEQPEPLRVVVVAPGGHRAEVKLFEGTAPPPPSSPIRDLLLGLALLLALAAFALSIANARKLRRLTERVAAPPAPANGASPRAEDARISDRPRER